MLTPNRAREANVVKRACPGPIGSCGGTGADVFPSGKLCTEVFPADVLPAPEDAGGCGGAYSGGCIGKAGGACVLGEG